MSNRLVPRRLSLVVACLLGSGQVVVGQNYSGFTVGGGRLRVDGKFVRFSGLLRNTKFEV